VLQRESASPFAKMLLQGSQADFRARIISYQRFRVRQVVLAELAERVTCVHAIEELWELYLHFHDHRTVRLLSLTGGRVLSLAAKLASP